MINSGLIWWLMTHFLFRFFYTNVMENFFFGIKLDSLIRLLDQYVSLNKTEVFSVAQIAKWRKKLPTRSLFLNPKKCWVSYYWIFSLPALFLLSCCWVTFVVYYSPSLLLMIIRPREKKRKKNNKTYYCQNI